MIAIACDHGGFKLKGAVMNFLKQNGYEYKDFGTDSEQSCDYADYAAKVAFAIANGECERGILICGTGIGMSIAANKVSGIRAAHVTDCFSAEATRQHNNANVLCLGQRIIGEGLALKIVDIFVSTEFLGGRHQERIDMLETK